MANVNSDNVVFPVHIFIFFIISWIDCLENYCSPRGRLDVYMEQVSNAKTDHNFQGNILSNLMHEMRISVI